MPMHYGISAARGENARECYLVTSCKGGVGKSTATANLAISLAALGKRVLVVDCDFSNRSLDLILGCENKVVFDICDLVMGRATPAQTILIDHRNAALGFIPAPLIKKDSFTPEDFSKSVTKAAEHFAADIVMIDTPGTSDDTLTTVSCAATAAIIVASHQPTSVRGAEKTGYVLEELGVTRQFLLINRYDSDEVLAGNRPGLNELIDKTHIPLVGVIPESRRLELAQEKGKLATELRRDKEGVLAAFDETARRLCNERVPLMSYVPERKRRKLLYT